MPKSINILTQNIQCLSNKKTLQLRDTLEFNKFDILMFSEHWQKDENINLIKLPNFKLGDYYARKSSCRGGSCIYINDKLDNFNKMNNIKVLCSDLHFEISCIQFTSDKIIFGSFYRSPHADIQIVFSKL